MRAAVVKASARDQVAAKIYPHEWGALHRAVFREDVMTVRDLLARGFDTRVQDERGRTPLHSALHWRYREVAHLLAEADSGIDIEDAESGTPLHYAIFSGWEEIVRRLVAAGARLRYQNCLGKTALHCALCSGKEAIAQFLLEQDSEYDVPDYNKTTLLHPAAERGYASIVKRLLLSGMQPHVKNDYGLYPLYLASSKGHVDVVKLILAVYALRGIEINEGDDLLHPITPSYISSPPLNPQQVELIMNLRSELNAEIQWMKETKIAGSNVSYKDIATRHVNGIMMYLRNEEMREELLSGRVALGFPDYADLIAQKVRRAEEKRILVDECMECFSILLRKLPPLPQKCMEFILLCLGRRDMESVIKAIKFC